MVEQDGPQLVLVFGLEKRLDCARRRLAEGVVCRGNTVKGPLPFRVSASPAACSAVANVLKLPAATAVSTMSFIADRRLPARRRRGH